MSSSDVSVKIKNYKCFRDEFVGFDCIKPINIIIGRNNSGKSSLLDLLIFATGIQKDPDVILQFQDIITENELKSVFKKGHEYSELYGDPWERHGKFLKGLKVSVALPYN